MVWLRLDLMLARSCILPDVHVSVSDTVQPTNALCITKNGLLFVAAEFGNQFHHLAASPGCTPVI